MWSMVASCTGEHVADVRAMDGDERRLACSRGEALSELHLPRSNGLWQMRLDDHFWGFPYTRRRSSLPSSGGVEEKECPDAVNTAWIRLVTPREDDTNRSRWNTDLTWRVVQSASFAEISIAARRMIRRKQRSHDVEKLVAAQHGYLISFVAAQHQEGEHWDVSRAIGELAWALAKESEMPKEDFGALVRQRRKERGLPVVPCDQVLPEVQSRRELPQLPDESQEYHDAHGEAHMRTKVAEFRVWQAQIALEEAEERILPTRELEMLEATYLHELATYEAACVMVEN